MYDDILFRLCDQEGKVGSGHAFGMAEKKPIRLNISAPSFILSFKRTSFIFFFSSFFFLFSSLFFPFFFLTNISRNFQRMRSQRNIIYAFVESTILIVRTNYDLVIFLKRKKHSQDRRKTLVIKIVN